MVSPMMPFSARQSYDGTLARALKGAYIVRDLATITAHWGERTPSVPMVTLDGEYAHPRGWIRGGSGQSPAREARACWRVSENCASFR